MDLLVCRPLQSLQTRVDVIILELALHCNASYWLAAKVKKELQSCTIL